MAHQNHDFFSESTVSLLSDLGYNLTDTDAAVVATMLAWERAVLERFDERRFVYNRKSGPKKNKNYARWADLTRRLSARGFSPSAYFDWFTYAWKKQAGKGRRQEKVPFVTRLGHASYLDRFGEVSVKWEKRESLRVLEIEDGAATMGYLLDGVPEPQRALAASSVIAARWNVFPVTWLALSATFWDYGKNGRITEGLAPEHLDRVRATYRELKRDPALASKLAKAYQESMLYVL